MTSTPDTSSSRATDPGSERSEREIGTLDRPPPCERNDAGQSLAEYALIVTFLATLVVGVLTVLGPEVEGFLLARVDEESTGEAHHAVSQAVYR